jgi:hypothetical protein
VYVQVLVEVKSVTVMLASQLQQLLLLQPAGTSALPGPDQPAVMAVPELPMQQLDAITQDLEAALVEWRVAVVLMEQRIGSPGQDSNGGSNVAWGHELQQLLRSAVPEQTAAALRDVGVAVCAAFPVKLCCNNPGCTSMAKVGEMLLGSSCSGCKAARYCSKACQGAAWKMGHSQVCKRITKAAVAAGAAQ